MCLICFIEVTFAWNGKFLAARGAIAVEIQNDGVVEVVYSAYMSKKSDEEWQEALTQEQFWVTRQGGTERPHTGEYNHHDLVGIYRCVCCDAELFSSKEKFDSRCGWPSFSDKMSNDNVSFHRDTSHGMSRTEVRCSRCEAHLGHVFEDGPTDTGQRYCINSVSLTFKSET